MTPERESPELEVLLDYLKRTRGFDFTAYKRPSLMRRIQARMQTVHVPEFGDYIDYLEVHPDEFAHLFNTILINFTGFFRDPPAWDYLAAAVLPLILDRKRNDELIRLWSAGCASGEEAYTLAILLAERLDLEAFQKRVKIYATDVDEAALNQARQATYAPKDVEDVPPALLAKYFDRSNGQYLFHKELRRSVIFGRHDLVQDAPISRLDLIVSRNTLIYFNSETQSRILTRFHFALSGGGYLFLGKAEMLLTHPNLFVPMDLKQRVFVKVQPRQGRMPQGPDPGREEIDNPLLDGRIRHLAFETDPGAQILVDANGALALANERARTLFGIAPGDAGRPFEDLEVSHRPADLRSVLYQARTERRPILLRDVAWQTSAGEARSLDVQVTSLFDGAALLGTRVTFSDVTRYKRLQDELKESKHELETAYEELQSSNEELETTNEELQSSNEELETTNEELQSTNEELETMNEELQSTNEELETINNELRQRSDDLNHANAFLGSVLGGLRAGMTVVDRDLKVLTWNDRAEDLWGLRAQEVQGQPFASLDMGLPTSQLVKPIRECLSGEARHAEVTVAAIDRRGRAIQCTITCTPLLTGTREIRGAILLMETRDERTSIGREKGTLQ